MFGHGSAEEPAAVDLYSRGGLGGATSISPSVLYAVYV
jgi:hypothetical protein